MYKSNKRMLPDWFSAALQTSRKYGRQLPSRKIAMKQVFKYIDEKNALAILPVPQSSIQELEDMLAKVDPGQHRTKEG